MPLDQKKIGMPPRGDQCYKRKINFIFKMNRRDMCFKMVYSKEWFVQ